MTRDHILDHHRRFAALCLGLALPLMLGSCSTNPATGKSQLMLISEAQEIAMGREADPQIVASMGLYPDETIQRYVSDLGRELAAKSERPQLDWQFRVLDDPLVNAFALPGGYIYITRGILTHLNSEAELVSVLGHEIGHVVARHSANQISKQQLATIGLVVGSVLVDSDDQGWVTLAGLGAQLAFLKFSRDDERQADDLGLRYIDRAGYDPRPMTEVFDTLGRVSQAAGGGRGPAWFATHPQPENRSARLSAAINGMGIDFTGRPVGREVYYARLDGMIFGDDPRQGFFKDNVFYHPEMGFSLTFPAGWTQQNARTQVQAVAPNKDGAMALALAGQDSLEAAERAFFDETKANRGERFRPGIKGFQAIGSQFELVGQTGSLYGRVAFIAKDDRVFRILTYSKSGSWRAYSRGLAEALGSFEPLKDRRYLEIKPRSIDVVKLEAAMSLADFNRKYPSTVDLATLAILNHVPENGSFAAGARVKRVVGGEIP